MAVDCCDQVNTIMSGFNEAEEEEDLEQGCREFWEQ